ncbi:MAG: UDP-N-acetylmuramoyl-L-alanyl-D-glutamate--2,6-diaminopimelate ligase [Deltaproteobacteria bacterium]|nr:UDP-N-acetylmuramoyl-L-alanyl-D-glutamate--2,6-diaminopimelate ligase [Deltaproteobacteria bacterium]
MITVQRLKDIVGGRSQAGSASLHEITGICVDSRSVKAGDVFFAIPGTRYDGSDFVRDAITRGAVCAVTERANGSVDAARLILVNDPVGALAKFSAAFFENPSATMSVVGITGTNGKTTITYLLESIFRYAGITAGVVGTINYRFGNDVFREGLTTPFPHELQAALAGVKKMGGRYVFMEVSSHGIFQRRVSDIIFEGGIFTNLSRDHLDFHGDMENYFQVKKAFFAEIIPSGKGGKRSIVNIDCPYGRKLAEELGGDVVTYGSGSDAQYSVLSSHFSIEGTRAKVSTPSGEVEITSGLIGAHNLLNILASVTYAHLAGLGLNQVAGGVSALTAVPGRLERIDAGKPVHLFVDYAHSPDGLKNVLESLTSHKERKLMVVFGCGGDRDRGKRALMGRVAGSLADVSIVTSDNPRTEDPFAIIEEIVPGCEEAGARKVQKKAQVKEGDRIYLIEPDRKSAISLAIDLAREGDIILIAGKGHEPYQIIGERKIDFDDREVVRSIANKQSS